MKNYRSLLLFFLGIIFGLFAEAQTPVRSCTERASIVEPTRKTAISNFQVFKDFNQDLQLLAHVRSWYDHSANLFVAVKTGGPLLREDPFLIDIGPVFYNRDYPVEVSFIRNVNLLGPFGSYTYKNAGSEYFIELMPSQNDQVSIKIIACQILAGAANN